VFRVLTKLLLGLSPRRLWLPKKFGEVAKVTVVILSFICLSMTSPASSSDNIQAGEKPKQTTLLNKSTI